MFGYGNKLKDRENRKDKLYTHKKMPAVKYLESKIVTNGYIKEEITKIMKTAVKCYQFVIKTLRKFKMPKKGQMCLVTGESDIYTKAQENQLYQPRAPPLWGVLQLGHLLNNFRGYREPPRTFSECIC
jgi:hypothetical protein